MNTRMLAIVAVLVGGTASVMLTSGCAGSATKESTGEYFDDSATTARVKTALYKDPVASGMAISVETFKGVVQLTGFVNSEEEKTRAEQVARNVSGVASVENKLSVKSASQK